MNKCKFCNNNIYSKPFLSLKNSAVPAQSFTKKKSNKKLIKDLVLYECENCKLIQHFIKPVNYYKNVIRAVAFSEEMRKFRLRQFKSWIKKNDLYEKNFIEIGSGQGEYLSLISKLKGGLNHGIEFNKTTTIACTSNYSIFSGYISHPNLPLKKNFYDCFAIFSFMEHWPKLNSSLQNLNKLLKNNSYGIIEVPNFEMIYENGLFSEFTIDHILYFTKKTLRAVLEFNGFSVVSIKSIWGNYILSAEVETNKKINPEPFIDNFSYQKKQFVNFFNKFRSKKIVVWGAGHQSIANLFIFNLTNRVYYIVDSAPFKQNKYIFSSNLKVYDPSHMKLNQPDVILIMAAGFSNEVSRIIQDKFKDIQYVFVLEGNKIISI